MNSNLLDTFIKNNKESDDIFCRISSRDLRNGKQIYNKMLTSQHDSNYQIFGSNGSGNTCFSLYKSKDQIIYLILVNIQDLGGYTILNEKNEKFFNY